MKLTDDEILIELTRRELIDSYYKFFCYFWEVLNAENLVLNWHIEYLCNELQDLSKYIIERKPKPYDLIINIPPGSSKSSIVTIFYPVWLWLQDPSIVTITSSYSSGLSIDHSIKSRDIVKSELFQMIFSDMFQMKSDKDNKTNWANNYNGERITTSTGGTITGRHAHLIIVDDAMNAEMSVSEKFRETAHRFYTQTLSTRKKDKENTPTIYVEQRLHEADMTGYLLSHNFNVKHICIPGELNENVKPKELEKYYINGMFDVNRLKISTLKEMKTVLGSYGYAGQVLQNPAPIEGGYVKNSWFQYVNENETPPLTKLSMFIDGAYTDKTANDPTGIDIFGEYNNTVYWLFSTDKHFEMPELIEFLKNLINVYGFKMNNKIYIEPKASGKTIAQLLRTYTKVPIIELKGKFVDAGKVGRITFAAPTIESGRVKVVKGAWNDNAINQVCYFPNMQHDEHLDNLCYAINVFFIKKTVYAG